MAPEHLHSNIQKIVKTKKRNNQVLQLIMKRTCDIKRVPLVPLTPLFPNGCKWNLKYVPFIGTPRATAPLLRRKVKNENYGYWVKHKFFNNIQSCSKLFSAQNN